MAARNETTGADYRGGNVLRLESCELEHGYDTGRGWAGYRQWLVAGRVVRKGEHGCACVTVVTVAGDADGKGAGRKARGFRVFHYDQTIALADAAVAVLDAAPAGSTLADAIAMGAAAMAEVTP